MSWRMGRDSYPETLGIEGQAIAIERGAQQLNVHQGIPDIQHFEEKSRSIIDNLGVLLVERLGEDKGKQLLTFIFDEARKITRAEALEQYFTGVQANLVEQGILKKYAGSDPVETDLSPGLVKADDGDAPREGLLFISEPTYTDLPNTTKIEDDDRNSESLDAPIEPSSKSQATEPEELSEAKVAARRITLEIIEEYAEAERQKQLEEHTKQEQLRLLKILEIDEAKLDTILWHQEERGFETFDEAAVDYRIRSKRKAMNLQVDVSKPQTATAADDFFTETTPPSQRTESDDRSELLFGEHKGTTANDKASKARARRMGPAHENKKPYTARAIGGLIAAAMLTTVIYPVFTNNSEPGNNETSADEGREYGVGDDDIPESIIGDSAAAPSSSTGDEGRPFDDDSSMAELADSERGSREESFDEVAVDAFFPGMESIGPTVQQYENCILFANEQYAQLPTSLALAIAYAPMEYASNGYVNNQAPLAPDTMTGLFGLSPEYYESKFEEIAGSDVAAALNDYTPADDVEARTIEAFKQISVVLHEKSTRINHILDVFYDDLIYQGKYELRDDGSMRFLVTEEQERGVILHTTLSVIGDLWSGKDSIAVTDTDDGYIQRMLREMAEGSSTTIDQLRQQPENQRRIAAAEENPVACNFTLKNN